MPSISVEAYVGHIDVDVYLEDFETEDLREELERRGKKVVSNEYVTELLNSLYEKRRNGLDYKYELDTILYEALGRIS